MEADLAIMARWTVQPSDRSVVTVRTADRPFDPGPSTVVVHMDWWDGEDTQSSDVYCTGEEWLAALRGAVEQADAAV
ncbi:MAG TPA: hypothetical protein DCQ64_18285 [Candidatus Rokubacteria bacterium]|nr:hypothetical protein [Candidatus Rokubacteria bacterium]